MSNLNPGTNKGANEAGTNLTLYRIQKFLAEKNSLIILILLILVSMNISDIFLTKGNVVNILRQQTTYMLVSLGVMMVVMTGGIDLSISSIVAVGSILSVQALNNWGLPSPINIIVAILVSIVSGAVFGTLNGYLIANWRMKPFIVTIATSNVATGFAYILTKGSPIRLEVKTNPMAAGLVEFAQTVDPIFGLPLMAYVALFFVILFYLLMRYTKFGRLVVATGSNEKAVRLAGINVKKYVASAYIISGALAGFVGLLVAARSSMATPQTAADDYGITAISAVVIGGVSLEGGRGAVPQVVIGVFIMAIITNIMNLLSVAAYPQLVVKGSIIILAVLLRSISDRSSDKLSAK